jgi:hypothetical protein
MFEITGAEDTGSAYQQLADPILAVNSTVAVLEYLINIVYRAENEEIDQSQYHTQDVICIPSNAAKTFTEALMYFENYCRRLFSVHRSERGSTTVLLLTNDTMSVCITFQRIYWFWVMKHILVSIEVCRYKLDVFIQ